MLYIIGIVSVMSKRRTTPKHIKPLIIFINIYLPDLDPVYYGQIAMYDKSLSEVTELLTQKLTEFSELMPKYEYDKLQSLIDEGRYDEALPIAKHIIITYPNTPYSKKLVEQLPSLKHLSAIQNLQAHLSNDRLNAAE